MAKVVNKSNSTIWIGRKSIKPGESTELTDKELEFSGVKALLKSGELEVVEEKKKIKKK